MAGPSSPVLGNQINKACILPPRFEINVEEPVFFLCASQ
jgi:hypothetical protein